jgi:hypothetical protein
VDDIGIVPLDQVGPMAVALEQAGELLVTDPGQDRRVRDLVAVQVQDRQYCAVRAGVQELVGVPGRGQGTGLGFTVADDTGDHQVRVVQRCAVRVAE